MKIIERFGRYTLVEQHLRGKLGEPPRVEYQVRCGHKVVARHDRLFNAMNDATDRNDAEWDAWIKEQQAYLRRKQKALAGER